MATADRLRNLILENAVRNDLDPGAAVREFADVLTQLRDSRRVAEETQRQLVELGPQFAHYKGESTEPYAGTLLPQRDLKRSYAILKTRLQATNRSIAILCNTANGILGASLFHQGRLVEQSDPTMSVEEVARISRDVGELEILHDPRDGELIILEILH